MLLRSGLIASGLIFFANMALAETYVVDTPSSEVTFVATGTPGFLKIEGQGAKLSGTVTSVADSFTGEFTVELKDFKTGIALRDEHMHKKYLETDKHPKATLRLTAVKGGTFCGTLTLKEQTKEVCGEAQVSDSGASGKSVKASFKLNVKDFPAVGVPSHLGITMADTVEVKVNATAKKSP